MSIPSEYPSNLAEYEGFYTTPAGKFQIERVIKLPLSDDRPYRPVSSFSEQIVILLPSAFSFSILNQIELKSTDSTNSFIFFTSWGLLELTGSPDLKSSSSIVIRLRTLTHCISISFISGSFS